MSYWLEHLLEKDGRSFIDYKSFDKKCIVNL